MPRGNIPDSRLACTCGNCNRCKNREWRRTIAAAKRTGQPIEVRAVPGRVRTCVCGQCRKCHKRDESRQRRERLRRAVEMAQLAKVGKVVGQEGLYHFPRRPVLHSSSAKRLEDFFTARRAIWREQTARILVSFVPKSEHDSEI